MSEAASTRRYFKPVHPGYTPDSAVEVEPDSPDAVLVSSLTHETNEWREELHAPVLDLDGLGARLVPSSTPGNFHLYLDDVRLTRWEYEHLLEVLAHLGIVQDGFARQLGARGFTAVRIPGLKKGDPAWEDKLTGSSADSIHLLDSANVQDGEPF